MAEQDKARATGPAPDDDSSGISRRVFLKASGGAIALLGLGGAAAACDTAAALQPGIGPAATPLPVSGQYPEVPAPMAPPAADVLQYFSPQEAQLVEALTARILPGTPEDPGAREAGVVTYIDNLLAAAGGFAEKTYRHPPYAQVYTGDAPPADNGNYQIIWISADDAQRYGYQSLLTPGDVYRIGLAAVDRYANAKFQKNFVDLSESQQDTIVGDMASGDATGFDNPLLPAPAFFHNLRRHTSEGMFSDPLYGGNRDLVGWKLVGYPGAAREYTPQDMRTEGTVVPPQGLAQMQNFHPGEPGYPGAILPVSGSDPQQVDEPGDRQPNQ